MKKENIPSYCDMSNKLRELLDTMDTENGTEWTEAAALRKRLRELKARDAEYVYRRELIRQALVTLNELIKADGESEGAE